ncbi:MAG: PSD1 and planctomycete cytochrome C domain-containing protein [Pirellulaceae bacterium]
MRASHSNAARLVALAVILFASGFLDLSTASFAAEPTTTPSFSADDLDFYERKIRPLLVERCYECHSAASKPLQGGLRLDALSAVRAGGDSGPVLDADRPEKGLLVAAVRQESDLVQMPPEGKLSDREVALLVDWARRGAPMPHDDGSGAPRRGAIDFAKARQFWSFQPPRHHPLPPVSDSAWASRPLDRFILARLDAEKLKPAAAADRRTLLRRVKFDLLGLPPSPAEYAEFLSDERPDAYERLVDRLLASPHYGERWGRYWLDVARYTDTNASWLSPTSNGWLYRDWVVDALNDDISYDAFLKRQLATDQIPQTGPEDTPALGFLGLSPTYWKEPRLAPDVIKTIVADEWEERIDAIGRGLLGLTLACARCHDHKFDPVSSEDYYALAGVLASTRLVDRPIIPEAQAKVVAEAREKAAVLETKLSMLRVLPQPSDEQTQQIADLEREVATLRRETPHYDSPLAHAVDDAALYVLPDGEDKTRLQYKPGEARDLAVHIRGNPANPGKVVPRRFLRVLCSDDPPSFTHGGGRLDLAEAIVHEGRPLAARVIVNRVWMHHFGRGLVETPSNFGSQGSPPTHPQLLDDLTARFLQHDWSLKRLHREILLSSTYQQSSAFDPHNFAADPDNRLLWRMNRRRLDVEAWRDAMLAVAGRLDLATGGPSLDLEAADNTRRTLYGRVDRRNLHNMLRLYDFPAPESHSPRRDPTTTPLQQLFVLNSEFVRRQAQSLAARVDGHDSPTPEIRLRRLYQIALGRSPQSAELSFAAQYLASDDAEADAEQWIEFAHALLASNEFLFVD